MNFFSFHSRRKVKKKKILSHIQTQSAMAHGNEADSLLGKMRVEIVALKKEQKRQQRSREENDEREEGKFYFYVMK